MKVTGVTNISINYATGIGTITFDQARCSDLEICQQTSRIGYRAVPWEFHEIDSSVGQQWQKQEMLSLLLLVLALFLSMWTMMLQLTVYFTPELTNLELRRISILQGILSTPVVFACGYRFHLLGYNSLRILRPSLDLLVSAGSLSSFFLSCWLVAFVPNQHTYFDASAAIVTFLLLGRNIEGFLRKKVDMSTSSFLNGMPKAVQSPDEDWIQVEDLNYKDQFILEKNVVVATDCQVLTGQGYLNQIHLTGESKPLKVGPGSRILASSTLVCGRLVCEVLKRKGERKVDQLHRATQNALATKPAMFAALYRVTDWVVPSVFLLSILAFCYTYWCSSSSLSNAIVTGICVLIVACPCGIVLAPPLAAAAGISVAKESQIYIKSGDALVGLPKIRGVVFDKTGTLTKGLMKVSGVFPSPESCKEELLDVAVAMEKNVDHPLAEAILTFWGIKVDWSIPVVPIPGSGLQSTDQRFRIGTHRFVSEVTQISHPTTHSGFEIFVSESERFLGSILIDEELKDDAKKVVCSLVDQGIPCFMATGDSIVQAYSVASNLGLSSKHVYGELLPNEKLELIEQLTSQYGPMLYVGDGFNDSSAMAAAAVSMAPSKSCDAVLQCSDIIMGNESLETIHKAMFFARGSVLLIRGCVCWAFLYNLIAMTIAFRGQMTPAIASLTMALSSISVTALIILASQVLKWRSKKYGLSQGS